MPALGKDLSRIRSHLGLSIQDIQHSTKIPVATLKSIEDGSIFNHPEENQTYIRSFVRSYGRALKIDDDLMIKALDQNEAGNYNHLLLQQYPALAPEKQERIKEETDHGYEDLSEKGKNITGESVADEDSETPAESPETESQPPKEEPDVVEKATPQDDMKPKKTETEPSVKSVDWADVGRKFSEEKKHTPVWLVGLIIILIIAAFVAYFLYENGFFNLSSLSQTDQQEQVISDNENTQSSLSLELEDTLTSAQTVGDTEYEDEPTAELGDVIQLTVYAAYDGLGPVRVWSDLKPRMDPYWIEQGTAMRFEFQDTIRVRGSYEDFLLLKDGHLIEDAAQNFLQEEQNYIQLTRNFFEADEKWTTSIEYELPEDVPPPDSIAIRPTF